MASSKTLTPTNVTIQIPALTDAPNVSVLSNCIDKEADAINALNSNLNALSLYRADFTSVSPGKVDSVVSLPSGTGRYLIVIWYNGYTFANSASVYFAQRDITVNNWYGVTPIAVGEASRTVTMAEDGTLTKGDTNSYNVRVACLRLSQ